MDTSEVAFDAEQELDNRALLLEQEERRSLHSSHTSTTPAKAGVSISETSHEPSEQSPLIAGDQDEDGRRPSWRGDADFAHLPWHKRPSIYWMIGPFFIVACAFGGIIAPKINLILDLVCREYISERVILDPGFTMIPVDFNGGANDQCRIPEVQSRAAEFTLWGSLLTGLLAAFTSPKLGALSDRYGRKPVLIVTSIGTICGELITIGAARYPETFPVSLLLLSYAIDGLTGSFIVALTISNAYATDCTPPNMRNVAFGYFHGCLFTGIALGPIVAGLIVKFSGKIVTVFYVLTAVHILFVLFMAFVAPESLSKQRRKKAQEKHFIEVLQHGVEWNVINSIRALNILEPLKILRPTGPGTSPALRRNLLFLAIIDGTVFGVAMGSMTIVVIYTRYKFGWQTFESGRFMTIVNSARVFTLLVILPVLTRLFRGKPDPLKKKTGSDRFDLTMIRAGILFDTLGYVGYSIAGQEAPFVLSGVIASIGAIASPTLQSSLINSVPADRTGQLLGAIGLLHALARVIAPAVFNGIYSLTVDKFTPTVFICLTATFGLALVSSLCVRPHVFFDEDLAADAAEEVEDVSRLSDAERANRIPLISSLGAAARKVLCLPRRRSSSE